MKRKRIGFLVAAIITATVAVFTAPDAPWKASAQSQASDTAAGSTSGALLAQRPAAKPVLQTGTNQTNNGATTYAALGDSVAAGLGLPGVSPASGYDGLCGRSTESYPYIVSNTLGMPLNHAACSGATAGDLITKQGVPGKNITAQLTTAFAAGKPQLITITAGANDAHWDDFIRACYATSCNNKTSTTLANGYLKVLQAKLHTAYASIYLRSDGTPPPVVVTGYYNPLSAACSAQQSNITPSELIWIQAETAALNQTIKNVSSKYSFVTYAAVDFSGHDICSSDSWVQGLNDNAPFHPTAAGQQVIAQSVLRAVGR